MKNKTLLKLLQREKEYWIQIIEYQEKYLDRLYDQLSTIVEELEVLDE
jgi:Mg2+ and Co2+ transporter CorA